MLSICPIFPSACRILSLVGELVGRSAASGKMGKMGLENMGISSHFSLVSSHYPPPPVFRHFSATGSGCSYNFESDFVMNPHSPPPHFPPVPPIFPHFFIFPIFPGRLWGLGDFGFGYLGALHSYLPKCGAPVAGDKQPGQILKIPSSTYTWKHQPAHLLRLCGHPPPRKRLVLQYEFWASHVGLQGPLVGAEGVGKGAPRALRTLSTSHSALVKAPSLPPLPLSPRRPAPVTPVTSPSPCPSHFRTHSTNCTCSIWWSISAWRTTTWTSCPSTAPTTSSRQSCRVKSTSGPLGRRGTRTLRRA